MDALDVCFVLHWGAECGLQDSRQHADGSWSADFSIAHRSEALAVFGFGGFELWASFREGRVSADRARGLALYQELTAATMPRPVRLAALRVLNGAGPAPEYSNRWPAPTGDAAAKDKSGFLGR